MRYTLSFLLLFLVCLGTHAQSSYIPTGSYSIHVLDRMEIKQGRLATPDEFNTTTKAYQREHIAHFVDSFDIKDANLSKQDYFNMAYLQDDNFEYSNSENTKTKKRFLGTGLFKHYAAVYDVQATDFKLVVNPVVYQKIEYDGALKEAVYLNCKGIELRGAIGKHVSFYTQIRDENQTLNSWNQDFYNNNQVIVGETFLNTKDYHTFNYNNANGYVAFQAGKYFDIQVGHGKNFIGNGYRSLMMSDFSNDLLFCRINTRIWKINYTNIWGQMVDYQKPTESLLPKRHYFATTHASINITKRFNLGLFQTISFQRDSGYSDGGFDAQYLNPIIFYKPIENSLNSPDKTILGFDMKYNFAKHFSLYSQVVISEFTASQAFTGNGYWANKSAIQLGLKYIDVFGVKNLDVQLEYNHARPYMYTSFDPKNAYVNYNQNMAHPTGANFRENITIIRYQPLTKLMITTKMIISKYGNDTNGSNWGRDIRLSYDSRQQDYNNVIGQGVTTHLYVGEITMSYMFWHNMFIDFQLTYRKTKSQLALFDTETLNAGIAFRWNINTRGCDF